MSRDNKDHRIIRLVGRLSKCSYHQLTIILCIYHTYVATYIVYFIKVELTVLLHVNTIASGMAQRYSKRGRLPTWVSLYNCMLIILC